ncbi:hypothetical protein RDI58_007974 [Solanum bulbocastanum]|uniref:Uncharacterized protein n=1 Tax=Solanum bulbocastanum TaxID=147425 RepID=A0AAN8TZQ3_SOLBU
MFGFLVHLKGLLVFCSMEKSLAEWRWATTIYRKSQILCRLILLPFLAMLEFVASQRVPVCKIGQKFWGSGIRGILVNR